MKKILLVLSFLCFGGSCIANATLMEQNTDNKKDVIEKENVLQISGSGSFSVPLVQERLVQDGTSGLAYEKKQQENEQVEPVQETQQFQTRRLKAVEKEYTLSGTTFDVELNNSIQELQDADFQVSTMEEAAKDVKRQNTLFVECSPEDPDCVEYKVDEAGEVIW